MLRRQQSETREKTRILELYHFDVLRDHYILKLNPMANWAARPGLGVHQGAQDPVQSAARPRLPLDRLLAMHPRRRGRRERTRRSLDWLRQEPSAGSTLSSARASEQTSKGGKRKDPACCVAAEPRAFSSAPSAFPITTFPFIDKPQRFPVLVCAPSSSARFTPAFRSVHDQHPAYAGKYPAPPTESRRRFSRKRSRREDAAHLDALEAQSIFLIREAYHHFKNICMPWSMGKDSNVLIWLSKKAFCGHIPYPLLHIDTTYEFPEMLEYRDWAVKYHGLNLIVKINEDARAGRGDYARAARSATRRPIR